MNKLLLACMLTTIIFVAANGAEEAQAQAKPSKAFQVFSLNHINTNIDAFNAFSRVDMENARHVIGWFIRLVSHEQRQAVAHNRPFCQYSLQSALHEQLHFQPLNYELAITLTQAVALHKNPLSVLDDAEFNLILTTVRAHLRENMKELKQSEWENARMSYHYYLNQAMNIRFDVGTYEAAPIDSSAALAA